ncbi:hypothetical protein HNQ57_001358 [Zhongshania antarctica]|uniref:Uncharacterized protein n=1 Tax=Zhongshania antarctica TaxID=641702 RepID=A0A840R207_9GAMM|nr:hypothetical protein [Zhongshania antarctica]MBB5187095.1 hypothetical protein [Zhongshania antarctica]
MDYLKVLRLSLLFLGKSLLAVSGACILSFMLVGMFEGTASITELSILELLFSAVLCFFVYRHCKNSMIVGLKWHRILYLPLSNCGYLLPFWIIFMGRREVNAEAVMGQLFGFGLILFNIYTATPRLASDQGTIPLEPEEKTS